MFGDIKAINAWASSEKKRNLALATNGATGEQHPKKSTCTSGACRRIANRDEILARKEIK